MTTKIILTVLGLAAVMLIPERALSQSLSLSLKGAQDTAVKNSYSVTNAQYDLDIARKKVKENLSYGFPQIDASVDYSYYIGLPTSLIPAEFAGGEPGEFIELQFGLKNNLTAGVTLNQLIFDGRYFIGLEYAKIYEQLSMESLEKSEEDIKEAVTQTYFNILVGQEAEKVLDSTLVILEKTRYETVNCSRKDLQSKPIMISSLSQLPTSATRSTRCNARMKSVTGSLTINWVSRWIKKSYSPNPSNR